MGDENEYQVEEIVNVKYHKEKRHLIYLIKWLDYPSEENTWEPQEHLINCDQAIRKFKLGKTFRDYVERLKDRGIRLRKEDLEVPDVRQVQNVVQPPEPAIPLEYPKVVGVIIDDCGRQEFLVCMEPDTKPKRIPGDTLIETYPEPVLKFMESRLLDSEIFNDLNISDDSF